MPRWDCSKAKACGQRVVREFRLGSVVSAVTTRIVFATHSLFAFWRVANSPHWTHVNWLLLSGLLGLAIETIVTVIQRKGEEYKWFCPSVFFYLSTIVPSIWLLEFDMFTYRMVMKSKVEKKLNITFIQATNNSLLHGTKLRLDIPHFDSSQWVVMVEQLLLFVLILGRWMLPKGKISRDELSQLLLVYIGMAADIIEFFETFKEELVKYNIELTVTILVIWSTSLLQFTLVLTASKSKKRRGARQPNQDQQICNVGCCRTFFFADTEVFGIITTMLLQDGPFLTLRLVLLLKYNVRSYMHIFFTVKNSLVLLLMFYRLLVLYEAHHEMLLRRRSSSYGSSYGSGRGRRRGRPSIAYADLSPLRQAMMATVGMMGGAIKEEVEPSDKQASNGVNRNEEGGGDGQASTSRGIPYLTPSPLPTINIEPDGGDGETGNSTTQQLNDDKRSYAEVVKGIRSLKDRAKVTFSALKVGRLRKLTSAATSSAATASTDDAETSSQNNTLTLQRQRETKTDGSAIVLINSGAVPNIVGLGHQGHESGDARVPIVDNTGDEDDLFRNTEPSLASPP